MHIHQAGSKDLDEWCHLALALWPDDEADDMQTVLTDILRSPTQAGFLVRDEQGIAIGFMNLSLRTDYVPGATQSPVAFVEGIYVEPAHQQKGIGCALIQRAEQWARNQGCTELASDVTFGNLGGEAFHKKAGFEEVERVIQFIKQVE